MAYIYDLTDTWNAGATTFNGIKLNVTDTASAAASKLITLQTTGTEHFSVTKAGVGYVSGSLGVGTSLPGAVLQLNKASGAADMRLSVAGTLHANIYASSSDANIFAVTAIPLIFGTNNTEKMRITSAGNFGVGTTTPNYKVDANGIIASYRSSAAQAGYWTYNGGATAEWFTGQRSGTDHAYKISQVAAGIYTDRVTITTAGDVGIGTASPTQKLTVQGGLNTNDGTINTVISTFSGASIYGTSTNHPQAFYVNGTERVRIDTSGFFKVGTTVDFPGLGNTTGGTSIEPSGSAFFSRSGANIPLYVNRGGDGTVVSIRSSGTEVGSISVSGSTTSFNTSSDYRLKDIDGPIANSGAYIDALNPVQGSWKADGSRFIGLLAHEVQEVSETPIATGEKDGEEMQAMDYSAPELITNLIAEIQSLRARVAQLEGN